ncbi:hypothetical protein [Helcococcus kunzii]|uniref:hypothetical protein n=1 Tax=Helcococcus kunzii TaxID=40091 RepID=UPI00389F7223
MNLYKENKTKILELLEIAGKLEENGADVFVEYSGHVSMLEIKIYKYGWNSRILPEYSKHIFLGKKGSDEQFYIVITDIKKLTINLQIENLKKQLEEIAEIEEVEED